MIISSSHDSLQQPVTCQLDIANNSRVLEGCRCIRYVFDMKIAAKSGCLKIGNIPFQYLNFDRTIISTARGSFCFFGALTGFATGKTNGAPEKNCILSGWEGAKELRS